MQSKTPESSKVCIKEVMLTKSCGDTGLERKWPANAPVGCTEFRWKADGEELHVGCGRHETLSPGPRVVIDKESKFSKAEVTPRFPAVINSTSGGANVSLSRSTSHGEDAVKGNNLFAAPTHLQELQTLSLSADGERNFSGELAQTADSKHFANGARNGQGGDTAAVVKSTGKVWSPPTDGVKSECVGPESHVAETLLKGCYQCSTSAKPSFSDGCRPGGGCCMFFDVSGTPSAEILRSQLKSFDLLLHLRDVANRWSLYEDNFFFHWNCLQQELSSRGTREFMETSNEARNPDLQSRHLCLKEKDASVTEGDSQVCINSFEELYLKNIFGPLVSGLISPSHLPHAAVGPLLEQLDNKRRCRDPTYVPEGRFLSVPGSVCSLDTQAPGENHLKSQPIETPHCHVLIERSLEVGLMGKMVRRNLMVPQNAEMVNSTRLRGLQQDGFIRNDGIRHKPEDYSSSVFQSHSLPRLSIARRRRCEMGHHNIQQCNGDQVTNVVKPSPLNSSEVVKDERCANMLPGEILNSSSRREARKGAPNKAVERTHSRTKQSKTLKIPGFPRRRAVTKGRHIRDSSSKQQSRPLMVYSANTGSLTAKDTAACEHRESFPCIEYDRSSSPNKGRAREVLDDRLCVDSTLISRPSWVSDVKKPFLGSTKRHNVPRNSRSVPGCFSLHDGGDNTLLANTDCPYPFLRQQPLNQCQGDASVPHLLWNLNKEDNAPHLAEDVQLSMPGNLCRSDSGTIRTTMEKSEREGLNSNRETSTSLAGGVPASVHKAGGLAPLSTGSCDSTYTSRSGTRGIRPTKKCSNVIIEEAGVQFLFSTRKGVYYDKRRRLWRANWKEDGRIHTKGFSLNDYSSHEAARQKAIEFREMKEKETLLHRLPGRHTGIPNF